MMRHLLRLAWRRRRANALVATEIGLSFLVLAVLATIAAQFALNARRPLGFEGNDIWVVSVSATARGERGWTAADGERMQALLREARARDEVIAAAASSSVPYDFGERNWQFVSDGTFIDAESAVVTDDYIEVMATRIASGRGFMEQDHGAAFQPVIIDRDFERLLFRGESAVGRSLPRDGDDREELRVVGVVDEFRESGELSSPRPYFFVRKSLEADGGAFLENIVLRMKPGTPASAEPALIAQLRSVAPGWQLEVTPLMTMRRTSLRSMLVPLGTGALVAGFLLLMVAFGLVGVLWQNVSRRTREFALRRAVGATARSVRLLVLGELAMVACVAILAACAVAAQVPFLGLVPGLQASASALGLFASAVAIMILVLFSGLYPSVLAMRAEPAEALRHE